MLLQEDDYSDSSEAAKDPASFNEYETVWITGSLAAPGKQTYFMVYKFDESRVFKTQVQTVVSMRQANINHEKLELPEHLKQGANKKKNRSYYFDVFHNWHQDNHDLYKAALIGDNKLWP